MKPLIILTVMSLSCFLSFGQKDSTVAPIDQSRNTAPDTTEMIKAAGPQFF